MVGRTLLADPRASAHQIVAPTHRDLDFADEAACRGLMEESRPEVVVHLAAIVGGIQANIDSPVKFLIENVRLAVSVLSAARDAGAHAVFNIASSCMYPRGIDEPMAPNRLLTGAFEPTNEGYALAKVVAWKLGEYLERESPGLTCRTLVPCNLYGPFDDFDPVRAHLVPSTVRKVAEAVEQGRSTVVIWGDGAARREFMFAADLADFIWTHLEDAASLPPTMNIGVGEDHSVLEYYQIAARAAGWRGRFVFDRSRPVGMARKLLDVSAQTALGWAPKVSLDEGVARTLAHFLHTRTEGVA